MSGSCVETRSTDKSATGQGQCDDEVSKQAQHNAIIHKLSGLDKGNELEQEWVKRLGPKNDQIRPTSKRYIILLIFCLNSANKSFQWVQLPASTSKATQFYQVDNYMINALSVLFMLAFLVLSWPACFIIERVGLRKAILAASFGTALGSVVKLFSCRQDGIWILLFGQVLVSLSEQFIFSIPSRMASVWFPDHQVSSAVSLSILGNQLGVALGFLTPQIFLNHHETIEQIGTGYYHLFMLNAFVSIAIFLFGCVFFDEEPKYAPGEARLRQREIERNIDRSHTSLIMDMQSLFSQIGTVLKDRHLVVLALSYGINVGIAYTIQTLLDQMMRPVWPDDVELVGNTGFLIIAVGAFGSPLWGTAMDKLHKYKLINIFLTISTMISLALFGFMLAYLQSPVGIYITAVFLGLFQTGLIAAGLELAVELTYPSPELVTSSIMNVMPQIGGTIFIFIGSYIVDNYGPTAVNVFYLILLMLALTMLVVTKEKLKRQKAVASGKEKLAGMQ